MVTVRFQFLKIAIEAIEATIFNTWHFSNLDTDTDFSESEALSSLQISNARNDGSGIYNFLSIFFYLLLF